jgi:hypothetical protein
MLDPECVVCVCGACAVCVCVCVVCLCGVCVWCVYGMWCVCVCVWCGVCVSSSLLCVSGLKSVVTVGPVPGCLGCRRLWQGEPPRLQPQPPALYFLWNCSPPHSQPCFGHFANTHSLPLSHTHVRSLTHTLIAYTQRLPYTNANTHTHTHTHTCTLRTETTLLYIRSSVWFSLFMHFFICPHSTQVFRQQTLYDTL